VPGERVSGVADLGDRAPVDQDGCVGEDGPGVVPDDDVVGGEQKNGC
jgi:hypothetical protein